MTEKNQIYKCNICGNMVEIVHSGAGELVCHSQALALQQENTVEADQEKHIPVIGKNDDGFLVSVGSIDHPMVDEHYIEWIEIILDGFVYRQDLKPGDKPEAQFYFKGQNISARAYCNLHGLWKS